MSFLTSRTIAVPSETDNNASSECSWTTLSRRAGWPSRTTFQNDEKQQHRCNNSSSSLRPPKTNQRLYKDLTKRPSINKSNTSVNELHPVTLQPCCSASATQPDTHYSDLRESWPAQLQCYFFQLMANINLHMSRHKSWTWKPCPKNQQEKKSRSKCQTMPEDTTLEILG